MGIADPSISQPISTRNGVITHVGTVMGGGTSISLGIYIEEPWSFFEYLNRVYNAGWEENLFGKAHKEVQNIFGDDVAQYVTPADTGFGPAVGEALRRQGYEPVGGSLPAQPSPGIKRVEWERDANGPIAKCVLYHKTTAKDTQGNGNIVQVPQASSSARLGEWVGTLFDATSYAVDATELLPGATLQPTDRTTWRRACIKDSDKSRIIISAGAIQTAALLYRSGVGPLPQIRQIRARPVLEIPTLGQAFIDRVFVTLNLFQKHYPDKIKPVPVSPVRKLDAAEGNESHTEGGGNSRRRGRQKLMRQRRKQVSSIRSQKEQREHQISSNIVGRLSSLQEDDRLIVGLELPDTDDAVGIRQDGASGGHQEGTDDGGVGNARAMNILFPTPPEQVAPHLTGTLKDHLFPWFGELEPARICQATGIRLLGPTCPRNPSELQPPPETEPFLLQSPTLTCSAVPIGHVSGARVAEGVIYATRFILPPLFRSDPVADALFETLQACSEHREPFGLALLKPLCAVAYPIIKCFRQVYANFYYTAQPKSRGSVRVSEDGKLEVNSNHLQHEEDLFDAVRGVSTLLKMAKQDTYRKIVQDSSAFSCPATILNGLLDLMTTMGSTSTVFLTKPANFFLIQNHLQDLIPPKHRRLRRIVKLDEKLKPRKLQGIPRDGDIQTEDDAFEFEDYSAHVLEGLDLEKMEAVGIKKRLEKIGFDFDSYVTHLKARSEAYISSAAAEAFLGWPLKPETGTQNSPRNSTLPCSAPMTSEQQPHSISRAGEETVALRQAVEECRADCSPLTGSGLDPFCPAADVCCTVFGNSKCFSTAAERRDKMSELLQEAAQVEATRQYVPEIPFPGQLGKAFTGVQWAATYPPLLPNAQDPKAVAKYALSYMSSIWHHANTVPMGKIVDKNFDLIGARRLSVIDSSVLNELPRMNPTATMMMMGIYGGMVKQRQRMSS
uniref:Mandelonitrile lyase, putative n=1 Tax=Neospora caninum (strain Liverpool) TaxID=572307 RepID=A0A0F7U960_NEOCL|nr:TPA: mandelonitrile lyase, putative [Neospora caninum Liverpool]